MALSIPNIFVNGTAADANEVNEDFDAIVDYVNNEVMLRDGTFSFNSDVDFNNNKLLRVETPVNATDGANKEYVDAISSPIGIVNMFVGPDNKIPLKWVKCDGRALNRTTYSELFNIIGIAYGTGDGSTTFNVPNMTNAFPTGAAPGASGGSADAVAVQHSHPFTDYVRSNQSGTTVQTPGTLGYNPALQGISNQTQNSGESGVGKNLPPYVGFTFIIRTGV